MGRETINIPEIIFSVHAPFVSTVRPPPEFPIILDPHSLLRSRFLGRNATLPPKS